MPTAKRSLVKQDMKLTMLKPSITKNTTEKELNN